MIGLGLARDAWKIIQRAARVNSFQCGHEALAATISTDQWIEYVEVSTNGIEGDERHSWMKYEDGSVLFWDNRGGYWGWRPGRGGQTGMGARYLSDPDLSSLQDSLFGQKFSSGGEKHDFMRLVNELVARRNAHGDLPPDKPYGAFKIGAKLGMIYKNWKGVVRERQVIPIQFWTGSTEWHKDEQRLMKALDLDDMTVKDFAISDIQKLLKEGDA